MCPQLSQNKRQDREKKQQSNDCARNRTYKHSCRRNILGIAHSAVVSSCFPIAQIFDCCIHEFSTHHHPKAQCQNGTLYRGTICPKMQKSSHILLRSGVSENFVLLPCTARFHEWHIESFGAAFEFHAPSYLAHQTQCSKIFLFLLAHQRRSASSRSWSYPSKCNTECTVKNPHSRSAECPKSTACSQARS